MAEQKFYSPLKIGLLIVTIAYFVFNLHTMLTTEWIGEWTRFPGGFNTEILIEDINATACLIFRPSWQRHSTCSLRFLFSKKELF